MFGLARAFVCLLVRLFRSRQNLLIENLALRQKLAVFKRRNSRPKLIVADKIFWVLLRRFWSSWKTPLIVVSPDTVVRAGTEPASDCTGGSSPACVSRWAEVETLASYRSGQPFAVRIPPLATALAFVILNPN